VETGLKNSLEDKFCQVSRRDPNQTIVQDALSRLANEGEFLLKTGRHHWVKKRIDELNHKSNWPAYSMEVHLTYILEKNGLSTQNSKKLIPGDASDVDIIVSPVNGIEVRIECVYTAEPESFWQDYPPSESGIQFFEACYQGTELEDLFRKVQDKIRLKTVKNGGPHKFPIPNEGTVHLIVADVSEGIGFPMDDSDLDLICLGKKCLPAEMRMDVLGLYESTNILGSRFESEFEANKYLRERVHGIIFLVDRSSWHSPFNPNYQCQDRFNPILPMNPAQQAACDSILQAMRKLGQ